MKDVVLRNYQLPNYYPSTGYNYRMKGAGVGKGERAQKRLAGSRE